MTSVRELMTAGAECVGENESLVEAARKMRDLDVGALPIRGEDNRLKGMLTDRDIVVKCVAEGGDAASATAGQFGQGKVVAIGADDGIEEALRTMSEHQVRRLPVIDGDELVGMLTQADVARTLDESRTGEVVQHISSDGAAATDSEAKQEPPDSEADSAAEQEPPDSEAEQEPPDSNISGGRFGGKES